jgi:undecaprenyl-diphosphatase
MIASNKVSGEGASRAHSPLSAALNRLMQPSRVREPARSFTAARLAMVSAAVVLALLLCMIFIDAPVANFARALPRNVHWFFDAITGFGKSGWFLWPLGLLFLFLAFLPRGRLTPFAQRVLAAAMVRVGFLLIAIGLPGLFVAIVKRLVGRARPFVTGAADPFVFDPSKWTAAYASFPSGHSTTVFSVLVAFGALWPRARWVLWTYALLIAVSRIVVSAHYPSDVLAGAVVGSVGALMVRRYFALRHFGFSLDVDGIPRRLSGPSPRRIKAIASALMGQ